MAAMRHFSVNGLAAVVGLVTSILCVAMGIVRGEPVLLLLGGALVLAALFNFRIVRAQR
jgi:hypothetical protein